MSRISKDEHFSEDLQEVADVLHDQRPTLDPLALDRVKLRAMSGARRSSHSRHKGFFMRSRLTTVLATAFLALGTGGAVALACGGFSSGFGGGSAGWSQYKECDHGKDCHGKGGDKGGDKGKGGQGGGDKGGGQGGGDKGGQGGGGDKGPQGGKGGDKGGGDKGSKGGDKGSQGSKGHH
jgi:hypothetical protein